MCISGQTLASARIPIQSASGLLLLRHLRLSLLVSSDFQSSLPSLSHADTSYQSCLLPDAPVSYKLLLAVCIRSHPPYSSARFSSSPCARPLISFPFDRPFTNKLPRCTLRFLRQCVTVTLLILAHPYVWRYGLKGSQDIRPALKQYKRLRTMLDHSSCESTSSSLSVTVVLESHV